jgi:hypothetical protein
MGYEQLKYENGVSDDEKNRLELVIGAAFQAPPRVDARAVVVSGRAH